MRIKKTIEYELTIEELSLGFVPPKGYRIVRVHTIDAYTERGLLVFFCEEIEEGK